jgi:hypothetical protein
MYPESPFGAGLIHRRVLKRIALLRPRTPK